MNKYYRKLISVGNKTSNICKKYIVGSLVPVILLSVIVGTWTRHLALYLLNSGFTRLKSSRIL